MIGFLFLLIFTFFNISYADTNGIWLRAGDVLGDEDGAVFGSDFMDESNYEPDYRFFSDSLGIGTQDDTDGKMFFQSNQGKWTVGRSENNNFVFMDNSGENVFNLKSDEGYGDNSVLNINSQKDTSIIFEDFDDEKWEFGKNEGDEFFISDVDGSKRLLIENQEDSEVIFNESININGNNINFDNDTYIGDSFKVKEETTFKDNTIIEETFIVSGTIEENLDLGENRVTNLENAELDSDAIKKGNFSDELDKIWDMLDYMNDRIS